MITVDRMLTREQLDQLTEQRRQLTARLIPAHPGAAGRLVTR